MLEHALRYARMGLSVVPVHTIVNGACSCGSNKCGAPGKHPRGKWKKGHDTRASESELQAAWERFPSSNVGIITGKVSGIAVLDIDGEEGVRSLQDAGIPLEELPVTPTVRTGGGGIHMVFRYPERMSLGNRVGVLPKVDIRAEGGFVVAPPSLHHSGNHYEWVEGRTFDDVDPADFDWTLVMGEKAKEEQSEKPKTGEKWFEKLLEGVGEGGRNDAASKLAGRYFGLGMTMTEVTIMLQAWNISNDPPIPGVELLRTIKSIYDHEIEQTGGQDRAKLLEVLSRLMELKLNRVRRITGDEPQYVLEFDEGTCTMTTAQLLTPREFQQIIAEGTKKVVRKFGAKTNPTGEGMAQMIMNASEDVDAGMEATGVGELTMLLRDFLASQRIVVEVESDSGDEYRTGCFKKDGLLWVSLTDLVQRSAARWGVRTSIRQMAQRLRALGVEMRTFDLGDGSSRIMWGINPAEVDWKNDAA